MQLKVTLISRACILQLFGWNLKSLWQTANKHRCEALLSAKKHEEALQSYQYMMNMSDETMKASCFDWSTSKSPVIQISNNS